MNKERYQRMERTLEFIRDNTREGGAKYTGPSLYGLACEALEHDIPADAPTSEELHEWLDGVIAILEVQGPKRTIKQAAHDGACYRELIRRLSISKN